MSTVLLILAGLSVIYFGWGVLRALFWGGRRRRGLRDIAFASIAFIAFGVTGVWFDDRDAIDAGFLDARDHRAAKELGLEGDPQAWAARRLVVAADEQSAIAAEQAAIAAVAAAQEVEELKLASDAGFSGVDDYRAAQAAGIATADEWDKSRRYAAVARAVGSDLISTSEYIDGEFSKLTIEVKTRGQDGGNVDFFNLGNAIERLASEFRGTNLGYEVVDVMLSVPTLDKYGAEGFSDGGVLTWQGGDLSKIQADAPQPLLFRLATEVSLTRFGADMARSYCERNSLGDPRYCD